MAGTGNTVTRLRVGLERLEKAEGRQGWWGEELCPEFELMNPTPIDNLKTPAGGWTKATLAKLGISWPPPKGWKKRLEKSK